MKTYIKKMKRIIKLKEESIKRNEKEFNHYFLNKVEDLAIDTILNVNPIEDTLIQIRENKQDYEKTQQKLKTDIEILNQMIKELENE